MKHLLARNASLPTTDNNAPTARRRAANGPGANHNARGRRSRAHHRAHNYSSGKTSASSPSGLLVGVVFGLRDRSRFSHDRLSCNRLGCNNRLNLLLWHVVDSFALTALKLSHTGLHNIGCAACSATILQKTLNKAKY